MTTTARAGTAGRRAANSTAMHAAAKAGCLARGRDLHPDRCHRRADRSRSRWAGRPRWCPGSDRCQELRDLRGVAAGTRFRRAGTVAAQRGSVRCRRTGRVHGARRAGDVSDVPRRQGPTSAPCRGKSGGRISVRCQFPATQTLGDQHVQRAKMMEIIAVWMFFILFIGVVATVVVLEIEPLWGVRRPLRSPARTSPRIGRPLPNR